MSQNEKITVQVSVEVASELLSVARSVGFADRESLLKNYIREVILAARSDVAARQAKLEVVAKSDDLDGLMSERSSSDN